MPTPKDEFNLSSDDGDTTTIEKPNPSGEDRGDVVTPEPEEKPLDKKALQSLAAQVGDDDEPAAPEALPEDTPADKGGKAKPIMIPKDRFDEVNTKLRQVEETNRQLAEALARGAPAPAAAPAAAPEPETVDLKALRRAYREALLDGDNDKADQLDEQIQEETERRAAQRATEALEQAQETRAFKSEVSAVLADYPMLDGKAADADKEAIAEVIEWRDFLVATKNLPLQTAIRQAAERVAKAHGWTKAGTEGKAPAPAADPGSSRTESQRRTNAEAANRQPPQLDGGMGERASRPQQMDVSKMSAEEFSKLTPEEKKKLRGDSL